jgi:hypothetical protein
LPVARRLRVGCCSESESRYFRVPVPGRTFKSRLAVGRTPSWAGGGQSHVRGPATRHGSRLPKAHCSPIMSKIQECPPMFENVIALNGLESFPNGHLFLTSQPAGYDKFISNQLGSIDLLGRQCSQFFNFFILLHSHSVLIWEMDQLLTRHILFPRRIVWFIWTSTYLLLLEMWNIFFFSLCKIIMENKFYTIFSGHHHLL